MKKLTSNEIRMMWLSFFELKGHTILDGASLIPQNDKTLLWINSGVAALKQYFDGSKITKDRRIVNVQKSIRTNDIENVGKTNRHHTFFEMLGNFSIGDYFRKEVIVWGYEFLTSKKWLGLPHDLLYFTYHPTDLETKKYWEELGVKKSHLVPVLSNFWEIGEGPCGPNTEIFFDLGEKYDPEGKGVTLLAEDIDNDRYLELWNIVFSQYNAKNGVNRADYKELPSKNIDTGAGLERIASVMQETTSNFETDLFLPLMSEISALSKTNYQDNIVSYRVIADHVRTCTFALGDGASFANEGRGYVLRRLLRRAVRYGKKLGITEPFLYKLVNKVVETMKDFYPNLIDVQTRIEAQIKAEELRFLTTLEHGEALLRKELKVSPSITGEVAFKLYDTFGFPLEITKEIADELGVIVDEKGFILLLDKQKEQARASRSAGISMANQSEALLKFSTPSVFIEDKFEIKTKVLALFVNGELVKEADDTVEVIFEETVFYSESGGQISDHGVVFKDDLFATVTKMRKAPHGQHLHLLNIEFGTLKIGDELTLKINRQDRIAVMKNHTATHLLQKALNVVLGDEVGQAGSYVGEDYLRFDFTYGKRITKDEINKIEGLVNEYINQAIPLTIKFMDLENAKKLGAKALFLEKYGNLVRVVMFSDVSLELCGGTHVNNTIEVGTFAITSEGGVAAGIRRIQALSGMSAYEYLKRSEAELWTISKTLGTKDHTDLISVVKTLKENYDELRKAHKIMWEKQLVILAKKIKPVQNGNVNIYANIYTNLNHSDLGLIGDHIKSGDENSVIVLIASTNEEHSLLVSVGKRAAKTNNAGQIVKQITKIYGGSGGGRVDFANGKLGQIGDLLILITQLKEMTNG